MGVGIAAWNGAYSDGYVPVAGNWWASFWFILGDQAALIVLALSHTFEFITLKHLGSRHRLSMKRNWLRKMRLLPH
jgi:hypothetical protein